MFGDIASGARYATTTRTLSPRRHPQHPLRNHPPPNHVLSPPLRLEPRHTLSAALSTAAPMPVPVSRFGRRDGIVGTAAALRARRQARAPAGVHVGRHARPPRGAVVGPRGTSAMGSRAGASDVATGTAAQAEARPRRPGTHPRHPRSCPQDPEHSTGTDTQKPRTLRKCKLAVSGGMGQGEGGERGSCTRTGPPPPPVSFSYKKLLSLRQMCFAFAPAWHTPQPFPTPSSK